MKRITFRTPLALVLFHLVLAFLAAFVYPPATRGQWSRLELVPHGHAIVFTAYAQMTLLVFYFVFGRRHSTLARGGLLAFASIALGFLIWIGNYAPWNEHWFVRWYCYRLTLVPIPVAGLAACLLAVYGYRLKRSSTSAGRGIQFRSLHLILLTTLTAALLMSPQWQVALTAPNAETFAQHWKNVGPANQLKSELIYWGILSGLVGLFSFYSCLARPAAITHLLVTLMFALVCSLLAGIVFLPGEYFFRHFVANGLFMSLVIMGSCSAIKRLGFRLERVQ